jgi:hypothetical protein
MPPIVTWYLSFWEEYLLRYNVHKKGLFTLKNYKIHQIEMMLKQKSVLRQFDKPNWIFWKNYSNLIVVICFFVKCLSILFFWFQKLHLLYTGSFISNLKKTKFTPSLTLTKSRIEENLSAFFFFLREGQPTRYQEKHSQNPFLFSFSRREFEGIFDTGSRKACLPCQSVTYFLRKREGSDFFFTKIDIQTKKIFLAKKKIYGFSYTVLT